MDFFKTTLFFLLVFTFSIKVNSLIDPLSAVVIGGISLITYLLKTPLYRTAEKVCEKMGYCEGCEDYWIHENLIGLEFDLKSQVFGQELAINIILSILKNHLSKEEPDRALVLSFHGSPGTGKTFVTQKILKNMFIKGESSKYVKFYKGSIDFRSKDKVDQYQKDLVQTIQEKVRQCHRSMFVIDEVEKIPDGILDVISAAVQIGKTSEYDFRKVIFILLSNAGGTELNKEALSSYKQGIRREDMNLRRLTNLIATAAVNEGGLKNSQLVKNFDISYYVPFLPLERSHIVQCLEHFVVNTKQQVMSPELTELVLEDMTFRPEDEQLYSTSGCKGVEESAVIHIEGQLRRKRGRGPA